MFKDKRVTLLLVIVGILAYLFWTQSRYPQLDDKAIMGGEMPTEGISFDIPYPITENLGSAKKIVYNTLNWIETNRKGMTFGLLLASCLLLLFHLLKDRQYENAYANSAIGLLIGAPLGVCVNCAAPIAQGMKSAGSKTETAIATMISSPTFNIIILTMLFSMYPVYYVWIKLALTILLVLLIVPVLSRLPTKQVVVTEDTSTNTGILSRWLTMDLNVEKLLGQATWSRSLVWVINHYMKALWLMIKIALPLMLLAGILGNILITFLPLEEIVNFLPQRGKIWMLVAMIGLAVFGTFLPVPMTFDVIIVLVLMNAGLSAKYALPLLFTLGSFSIYSYLIIHKSFSPKLALGLYVSVVGLGFIAGLAGHYMERRVNIENKTLRQNLTLIMANESEVENALVRQQSYEIPEARKYLDLLPDIGGITYLDIPADARISQYLAISKAEMNTAKGATNNRFTPIDHQDHGIIVPYSYSIYNLIDLPFTNQRSISVGDIHHDGWPDVIVSSGSEIFCYSNMGNMKFARQSLEFKATFIVSVALVDMNNDGWLDIFITTFKEGNYIIYNSEGRFTDRAAPQPMDSLTIYSVAPAFGDLDQDGSLDYYLANTYGVQANKSSYKEANNYGYLNHIDKPTRFQPHTIGGVTHSNLMSDIDMDGDLDILEGNDFAVADFFMLNNPESDWKVVERRDSLVPSTSTTTMSYHSADLNNDLTPELISVQHEFKKSLIFSPETTVCAEITDGTERQNCIQIYRHFYRIIKANVSKDFKYCPPDDINGCIVASSIANLMRKSSLRKNQRTSEEMHQELPSWPYFDDYFLTADRTKPPVFFKDSTHWIPQVTDTKWNGVYLLEKESADTTYHFTAPKWRMNRTGWAWNAKAADLDNDSWQDIYIANGFFFLNTRISVDKNIFYRNVRGEYMEDLSAESGLASPLISSVFSYSDLDRDGDLDIILCPEIGPTVIYQNNNHEHKSIAIELRDSRGNHFGIGSKVYIYAKDGHQQYREILASGGFKSFDEPIAHFGLGQKDSIDKVVIQWSTGEMDTIHQSFPAGNIYRIERM